MRMMILCEVGISSGDWIAIIGVIVSIFLGTYVVNHQTKNRVQKDFFIKEIENLKNEYASFLKDIRAGKLSSESIRDSFKIFSDRIHTLNEILDSEYILARNEVFTCHATSQVIITGFSSVEDQYSMPCVQFSVEEKSKIDNCANNINKSMMDLIVCLNRADSVQVWNQRDIYNY